MNANSIGESKLTKEGWEKWRNDWDKARERVRENAKKRGVNLSEIPILCYGEIKVRAKK